MKRLLNPTTHAPLESTIIAALPDSNCHAKLYFPLNIHTAHARTHMEIGIALCAERKGCINQGCLHHVGTLHKFKGKYFNKQSSNTVCTVTDLYIAAYPKAEVLLLIPVWLQLINGKRGNSQQTRRGQ